MKRIFTASLIAAALFLAAAPASAAQQGNLDLAVTAAEKAKEDPPPAKNIDITDEAAIADAYAVSQSLTHVTELVTKCTQETEPPQECQCKFQQEMGVIRTSYDVALARHPDWKDKVVNFRKEGGDNISVSFPGVAAQLETCK